MHGIFTSLLIAASTSSRNLSIRDPTFQLPIWIVVGSANFLTLRTRREKCKDLCSFFTTPGRRCSAPLGLRRPDPCSLFIVTRSRYDAPLSVDWNKFNFHKSESSSSFLVELPAWSGYWNMWLYTHNWRFGLYSAPAPSPFFLFVLEKKYPVDF